MRLILLSVIVWPSLVSATWTEMSVWKVGAQLNLVGDQEINQAAMEWNPAFGLEVGLEFEPWSLGIAWRHMNAEAESGNYRVETNQERLMLNGRRSWHGDSDWLAWVQASVGVQWHKVNFELGSSRASESSDQELVSGLGLGFGWPLEPSWRSELSTLVHQTQTRSAIEASASVSLVYLY